MAAAARESRRIEDSDRQRAAAWIAQWGGRDRVLARPHRRQRPEKGAEPELACWEALEQIEDADIPH
jgi:hypothetical protein